MPRKRRTHEEYIEELVAKGIPHVPLEPYTFSKIGILHQCPKGHQWKTPPSSILSGRGCPECKHSKKRKSQDTYVKELDSLQTGIQVLEEYVNNITPILHRCSKGHEWKARPNAILSGGIRCPKCSVNRMKTSAEYAKQLLEKGINFTLLGEYAGARVPTLHKCSKGHTWNPTPDNVLKGQGCPGCATYGFKPEQPAILYYVKVSCEKDIYYKVGITNKTVTERFSKDKDKEITVLLEKHFDLGLDAYEEEKLILQKYKAKKAKILSPFLKGKGDTELFEEDVLGLDT